MYTRLCKSPDNPIAERGHQFNSIINIHNYLSDKFNLHCGTRWLNDLNLIYFPYLIVVEKLLS